MIGERVKPNAFCTTCKTEVVTDATLLCPTCGNEVDEQSVGPSLARAAAALANLDAQQNAPLVTLPSPVTLASLRTAPAMPPASETPKREAPQTITLPASVETAAWGASTRALAERFRDEERDAEQAVDLARIALEGAKGNLQLARQRALWFGQLTEKITVDGLPEPEPIPAEDLLEKLAERRAERDAQQPVIPDPTPRVSNELSRQEAQARLKRPKAAEPETVTARGMSIGPNYPVAGRTTFGNVSLPAADGVKPWSQKHPCCINCGTDEKKHAAGGRCTICYAHYSRYGADRDIAPEPPTVERTPEIAAPPMPSGETTEDGEATAEPTFAVATTPTVEPTPTKWHYLYPSCRACTTTEHPHKALGYCEPCYRNR